MKKQKNSLPLKCKGREGITASEFFPGSFEEEQEKREDLQTSCKHIKDKDTFGQIGKRTEISHRTNDLKSRTNVVECSCYRREVCDQIKIIDRDQQNRCGEDHKIQTDINIGGSQDIMGDDLVIHLDLLDCIRMKVKLEFFLGSFTQDQNTGNLDSTACTSGTGSDKHQKDQNRLGQSRPLVEVGARKTGRCDNGTYLECSLLECSQEVAEQVGCIQGDDHDRHSDDPEVITNLLIFECLAEFLGQDQIVCGEVDTKQDHKDRSNNLAVSAVASKTVIDNTESTGSGSTKGNAQRIKKRNPADQKQSQLDQCHSKVDRIKDLCSGLYLRDKFADGRPRALCFHKVHMITSGKRKKRKQEHEDAHTADPMSETSPDQNTVRKDFHI